MKPSFNWLRELDILSTEAKLTFNHKGSTRNSTIFGGSLSIIGFIVSLIFIGYFMVNLFTKKGTNVVTALEGSNFINLTNTDKVPFLLRLTDKNNKPYEHPEQMYKVSLKYWYGGSNDTLQNVGQKTNDIPIERCDLTKHFGIYKELFENLTDIDTFYCAIPRLYNQSIYGVYGNVYPFGYYHFYVSMCIDNENCLEREYLEKELSNTYLDLRTIDYYVDSHDANENKHPHIKNERFMISMTVYKRIWFYINGIIYNKDEGFWFSFNSVDSFFQYESLRYDIDHRDIGSGTIPGTFVTLTFISTGKIMIYYQTFTKIQELIGTISGVIKFVMVVVFVINYPHSQSAYYLKLMNDILYIDMKLFKKRERALKIKYNLSLGSKCSQTVCGNSCTNSNISSSGYVNPTGFINMQSTLMPIHKAHTKNNFQLIKSKFNQTITSPTQKSKTQINSVSHNELKLNKYQQYTTNINSVHIQKRDDMIMRKGLKFGKCERLLPLNWLFRKEKYGELLKNYFQVVNNKLNVVRILQEIDKIEIIDEALRLNDSCSSNHLGNQLGQIMVVSKSTKKRNSTIKDKRKSVSGMSLIQRTNSKKHE